MELRFNNQQDVYNSVYEAVDRGLHAEELIPHVEIPKPPEAEAAAPRKDLDMQKPLKETGSAKLQPVSDRSGRESPVWEEMPAGNKPGLKDVEYFMEEMKKRVRSYHEQQSSAEVHDRSAIFRPDVQADRIREAVVYAKPADSQKENRQKDGSHVRKPDGPEPGKDSGAGKQMDLFEEKLLDRERKAEYKLIGQAFDTYWMIEFQDSLYIIDQHAAHERVLYERTLKNMKTREFTSQYISPPIILDLTMQEAELLHTYMDQFTRIGFELEEFGQESYAVRAVPDNLFSIAKKELLMEMIDSLSDEISRNLSPDLIDEKVASMSCKAAVKGNMKLSAAEVDALIGELLMLENPYHCPHGRPTIIAMTRRELEKKFKRIV